MRAFKFHKLRLIEPENISQSCKQVPTFEVEDLTGYRSQQRWQRMIEKLRKEEPLFLFELRMAIFNIEKLENFEYQQLKKVFHRTATDDLIERIIDLVSKILTPVRLIKFVIEMENPSWNLSEKIPVGLLEFKDRFLNHDDFTVIIHKIQLEHHSLKDFLHKMKPVGVIGNTDGQKYILETLTSAKDIGRWIDTDGYWIKEFIDACQFKPELNLSIIEAFVRSYISKEDKAWVTKLLSPNNELVKICTEINNEKPLGQFTDLSKQAPSVFTVLEEVRKLRAVIGKLAEASPERGRYWESKITQSSGVTTKSFSSGLVGLAVTFGEYVFVDFGPTGNPAIVYPKDVFERSIRDSSSWKDISKNKRFPGFATRDDGTLWHTSNWEKKFDLLIKRIKTI